MIEAAFRSSVRKIFVICDVDDVTSKPVVGPLGDETAGPITTLLLLADRDIHGVEVELDVVIDGAARQNELAGRNGGIARVGVGA